MQQLLGGDVSDAEGHAVAMRLEPNVTDVTFVGPVHPTSVDRSEWTIISAPPLRSKQLSSLLNRFGNASPFTHFSSTTFFLVHFIKVMLVSSSMHFQRECI